MVLIVDKTVSLRAATLREKLFSIGCPCAVSSIRDVGKFRPFRMMLTFTDVFDDARRNIASEEFTVAIGSGFVNSALSAVRVPDADDAFSALHRRFITDSGIKPENIHPFGVSLAPYFFVSDGFVEIYGNIVTLTESENMILKELLGVADARHPIPAKTLGLHCFSDSKAGKSNRAAVHISHINAKCEPYLRRPLVKYSHGIGYYPTVTLPCFPKTLWY